MSTVPVGDVDILAMTPQQFFYLTQEDRQDVCRASRSNWDEIWRRPSAARSAVSPFGHPRIDPIIPVNPFTPIDRSNEWLKDHTYVDMFGWKDAIIDSRTVIKQVMLLGIMGDAYLTKNKAGKEIIIFKGYAGLREKLPGTRYLRDNPIVHAADFVIGHKEMLEEAGKATKVAIVCFVAWDIVHECLKDKPDMTRLGVSILSDIFQSVAATYLGVAAGFFLGTLFATGAAPIVVTFAIVAGTTFLTGAGMAWIDKRFQLTEMAIDLAKQIETSSSVKKAISYANKINKLYIETHSNSLSYFSY